MVIIGKIVIDHAIRKYMRLKVVSGGITRITNRGLQGAVDGGKVDYRLGKTPGGGEYDPTEPHIDTSDRYGDGNRVSIEDAAQTQLETQEALDEEIVDENKFGSAEHKHGLPPCLRVKRERG